MLSTRLVSMVLAVGLVLVLQGCAETSTQRMINANDHNGLAQYYTQQAQDLREGEALGTHGRVLRKAFGSPREN